MKAPRVFPLLLLAIAVFSLSCGDDTVDPPCPECGFHPYAYVEKDLSHRSDVLNNIEFAYNKRRVDAYDRLLDDNFTFFFTEGGGGTPVQWGRPDEMTATSGLLAAATKIDLSIDWKDANGKSNVQWLEQISGTETWYYTTVFYHFVIKIGDTTYIPDAGSKAQFTVRNAGTEAKPMWKLVEFRDLGGATFAAMAASSTEPTSWGKVKSIYR